MSVPHRGLYPTRPRARPARALWGATGTTGAALKQRQDIEVVGVELEPEEAQGAAPPEYHLIRGNHDPPARGRPNTPTPAAAPHHRPRSPPPHAAHRLHGRPPTPRPPRSPAAAPPRAAPGYPPPPPWGAGNSHISRSSSSSPGSLTKVGGMEVDQVRSFNRTVTERVGALEDAYLDLGRPLGANRVLWEIGDGGPADAARDARPGLRLPQPADRVAAARRARRDRAGADKRVRAVSLTAAGRAERQVLDRRSDELARALLAPLSEAQRTRLVEAMGTVERLLTAGLVEIVEEEQQSPDAQFCLREYYTELAERFPGGFDASTSIRTDDFTFVVARLRGEPVGCGAIRLADSYIKRMWVSPTARGLGLGRRLLAELEGLSTNGVARLETHSSLPEAINLYRSAGYVEVEPFNDEHYAHHWFEKRLR